MAGVGLLGIALAVSVQRWNINLLTTLSLAIAASSLLPALVYSLFWSSYTRRGLLWTLYGGTGTTIALHVFSPVFSGTPSALFPQWHLNWFPLQSVALVSVPVGFLLGYLVGALGGQGTRGGPMNRDWSSSTSSNSSSS